MGLLDKAVLNQQPPAETPELDEMGKALRDRLLSLSGTGPETAISLLKAYGSFRAGACLSLDGDMYRSYAAVGIGNSIELSLDLLRKIRGGNRLFVDYVPPKSVVPAGTKFWAFSLDENDGYPPARILLVGEDKNYIFPGGAVETLVQSAKSAFRPPEKAEQAEEAGEIAFDDAFPPEPLPQPSPKKRGGGFLALAEKHAAENARVGEEHSRADVSAVSFPPANNSGENVENGETKILSFFSGILEKTGCVRGLIFEGEADVSRINGMVSAFASVTELKAGRCLIAGGRSLDCELLSHRLSRTFQGKELVRFSAENPREALDVLRSYL
jgi:hypothetical protein